MALFTTGERRFLEAVSRVAFANPFLPELAEGEKQALGTAYQEEPPFWSLEVRNPARRRANAWAIVARIQTLIEIAQHRLANGREATDEELHLYEDAAVYAIYHEFYDQLADTSLRAPYYSKFVERWNSLLHPAGRSLPSGYEPAHTFACFFQIARAFRHIFESITGSSAPAGRLRAAVWQSLFTHDMRRYRRTLFARMSDFTTLITGPSGSGKELVAKAIAMSRYLPFDERSRTFAEADLFHPIHIGSLTPTLVESELFGHRKGSFTGANEDRRGWLDLCPQLGAVFLDEIGELTLDVQVKLLRAIETRTFTAVGDTAPKGFHGKLIGATNRNLNSMIAAGTFREDFYFRLCSDLITTPSLKEQIQDSPSVLRDLVSYMARRNAEAEAESVAAEAYAWIERNLGFHYDWPGNYREVEQCVRNIMIRREYSPPRPAADMLDSALNDNLTAAELLRRYCKLVYGQTGSYEAAARRLGLDRRTVKAYVSTGKSLKEGAKVR